MARQATTGQAARALGLAPVTLQKYAQAGRVPCDTTPGGHRRFDIDETRVALGVPSRTVEVVRDIASKWVQCLPDRLKPVRLGVFGSVARGEDSSSSDVDLFVVRQASVQRWDRVWGRAKADLMVAICDALGGRDVDLLDLGADELERFLQGSPSLAESLERDLVLVA
jgi:predicted nucleotidyltransferase